MYDNAITFVYRVNVSGYDYRTNKAFYARVNVKASSPSKARDWVLTYPSAARLPRYTSLEAPESYKLRKQPAWLNKSGQYHYRFNIVQLVEWTCNNSL